MTGEFDSTLQESWSSTQRAVWEHEEKLHESSQAADAEGYLDLLDEDRFIGWPHATDRPATYDEFRASVMDSWEDESGLRYRYSLTPHAIVEAGNVAVSHYLQREIYDDEEESVFRFTHVWRKEDETWKIIGGQASKLPED